MKKWKTKMPLSLESSSKYTYQSKVQWRILRIISKLMSVALRDLEYFPCNSAQYKVYIGAATWVTTAICV